MRSNIPLRAAKSFLESSREVSYKPLDFLVKQIKKNEVDLVLDVGANIGQFASDLILSGYRQQIQSFEPVKSQYESLERRARHNELWKTHNFAFGDQDSEQNIFVSKNSGLSSSFLRMNENHLSNFPSATIVGAERVKIRTVRDYVAETHLEPRKTMLKLDVQGFESRVLLGCHETLKEFALCFLEVSLVPLYDKEALFLEILSYLNMNNHRLIDVRRGVKTGDGELLQVDILTKRASPLD
jgi:FkbM family methyltransferase